MHVHTVKNSLHELGKRKIRELLRKILKFCIFLCELLSMIFPNLWGNYAIFPKGESGSSKGKKTHCNIHHREQMIPFLNQTHISK